VSDTPVFDQTLSDVLLRARREVEAAQARCAEAEQRAAHAERAARVRRALVSDEVEERVRAGLAHAAPPLPDLQPPGERSRDESPDDHDELDDLTTPTVPSMAELLRSSAGGDRFFDSLLGAPVPDRR
jgi:hypothetical protein